jgi:hypothetical protein
VTESEFAHPPDFVDALLPLCGEGGQTVPLPSRNALIELVNAVFHAGCQRDEGRGVDARVIVAEPTDFPAGIGPPSGVLVLPFEREIPLFVQDLRKLSSAADLYRSCIGVSWRDDRWMIWGLITTGTRWVARSQGGRYEAVQLPQRLVITVIAPGRLEASIGYRTLAYLNLGDIRYPGLDVSRSKWLPALFRDVRESLLREVSAFESPTVKLGDDFIRSLAQNVTRRTLSLARNHGHGGLMIYLPDELLENEAYRRHLNVRYPLCPTAGAQRFRRLAIEAARSLINVVERHGLTVADWAAYQRLEARELSEADEALFELGHLLADFMRVDGALLVSRRLEIIGFGAEILDKDDMPLVYAARDLEGEDLVPEALDGVGTRHRAAYRFCWAVPEGLCVVISQDGQIRWVKQRFGKVCYWAPEG